MNQISLFSSQTDFLRHLSSSGKLTETSLHRLPHQRLGKKLELQPSSRITPRVAMGMAPCVFVILFVCDMKVRLFLLRSRLLWNLGTAESAISHLWIPGPLHTLMFKYLNIPVRVDMVLFK